MRATTIHGPRDIRVEDVPDPRIKRPTDAIVKVKAGCVCGSDLWPYRDESTSGGHTIGHEAIGEIVEVGGEVRDFRVGDFVVVPFCQSDNTCAACATGGYGGCENLGMTQSGQAEYTRVHQADGSLVAVPDGEPDAALLPSLLTLSDVMATGWHAAVSAGVTPGSTAVVVGDGAVGLCGVLAARELGAERIIALSRHEPRQELAKKFGATHIVPQRGKEATAAVMEITGGVGSDATLECVGMDDAMRTAFAVARPGTRVGFVGVPQDVQLPIGKMFSKNIGLAGGMAPVRKYLPDLLDRVLTGAIDPGQVFDLTLPLEQAPEAYRAMDERRAIKVLLQP